MSSSVLYAAPTPIRRYQDVSDWSDKVTSLQLSDVAARAKEPKLNLETKSGETDLTVRLARERANAVGEVEQLLRSEYEQKLNAARKPISSIIASFEKQRDQYFAKVEAEVVQLALSIAAKILHRESQVDPMLVGALVRLAIDGMREGSSISVRVNAAKTAAWQEYFANTNGSSIEIVADPNLNEDDCIVETELGSAEFGLTSQLKEVEQGFFDLLALRPASK